MFSVFEIVSEIKKSITKKEVLIVFLIIALYFLTRLLNILHFPIFSDEGIYIHWAKVARADATWRFISLTDGKQPLQTWATIPFLKLLPDNALLAGRLFAVFSGFFALTGVYTLTRYLFGKKAAVIGGFLYVFTPYFLFYDRMALVDSAVNGFFVWILFLSIILARYRRLDIALIFGFVGGIGSLAKSSIRIFIGLAGLAPVLFFDKKNINRFLKNTVNYLTLYIIGVLLSLFVYNVQRLSPFFHFVSEKNKTFVSTLSEFLHAPFALFLNNVKIIPLYVGWESGLILTVLGIIGLAYLYRENKPLFWYLSAWIIIPFFMIAFFSKVLFPRYIIFFATTFLLTASYLLSKIKKQNIFFLLIGLIVLSIAYFDYTILFDQRNIPFPPVDRGQYIEAWPAGWGAKEIVDFARTQSAQKPVILIAEGNFGMTGDVLDVFLKRGDRIGIKGYWPLEKKDLLENQPLLKDNLIYVVYAHKDAFESGLPLKLIQKYDKPGNQSAIYLFELTK